MSAPGGCCRVTSIAWLSGAPTAGTSGWPSSGTASRAQAVSRKLGYEPDGISVDARGDEALVSDRLRLTRERWSALPKPPVRVEGFDACRSMFGI